VKSVDAPAMARVVFRAAVSLVTVATAYAAQAANQMPAIWPDF
jgi:hypothetical protein